MCTLIALNSCNRGAPADAGDDRVPWLQPRPKRWHLLPRASMIVCCMGQVQRCSFAPLVFLCPFGVSVCRCCGFYSLQPVQRCSHIKHSMQLCCGKRLRCNERIDYSIHENLSSNCFDFGESKVCARDPGSTRFEAHISATMQTQCTNLPRRMSGDILCAV